MVLWWIGNVVLLVVVLPVVIFLLNRVLAAVERRERKLRLMGRPGEKKKEGKYCPSTITIGMT